MLHTVFGAAMRPSCLLTLRLGTQLLKQCVAAGLTLQDVGNMMVRGGGDGRTLSTFELAIATARRSAANHLRFSGGGGGESTTGTLALRAWLHACLT